MSSKKSRRTKKNSGADVFSKVRKTDEEKEKLFKAQCEAMQPKRGTPLPPERVSDMFKLIEKNWPTSKIATHISEKHGISYTTARDQVYRAYRIIGENADVDKAYCRGVHLVTLQSLYERIMGVAEEQLVNGAYEGAVRAYATALRALDQQARIRGIYDAQKVEITTNDVSEAKTPFEKSRRIAELLEKRQITLNQSDDSADSDD